MSGITLDDVRRRQAARSAGLPLSSSWAEIEAVAAPALRPVRDPQAVVEIGAPPIARRTGDSLWLSLAVIPRTKKNSSRGNGKVSAAAVRFAHLVRQAIAPHADALGLPLPDRPYNCAAVFTTDNDRADTVGLMQALADALEPHEGSGFIGVLTNDRWIRTWNDTDQVFAPLRPGITLTLTPIGP